MRPDFHPSDGWLNPQTRPLAPIRIVHVWAISCGLCKAQMPSVRRWLSTPGIDVVSVHTPLAPSDRRREGIEQVASAHGLSAPIALDGDGRIADTLEVCSLPAYFVYDDRGLRFVAAGAGADRQVDDFLAALAAAGGVS